MLQSCQPFLRSRGAATRPSCTFSRWRWARPPAGAHFLSRGIHLLAQAHRLGWTYISALRLWAVHAAIVLPCAPLEWIWAMGFRRRRLSTMAAAITTVSGPAMLWPAGQPAAPPQSEGGALGRLAYCGLLIFCAYMCILYASYAYFKLNKRIDSKCVEKAYKKGRNSHFGKLRILYTIFTHYSI